MVVAVQPPGIRVVSQPPALVDTLPRLDVAVFVGFAACGPIHQPVVVEDTRHFVQIFGGDLQLALGERGPVHAYLWPTVRAFFRNGGRRCWIIRVADTERLLQLAGISDRPAALSNRFRVPGFLAVDRLHRTTAPVYVEARSEGSWSDGIRVSTRLVSDDVRLTQLTSDGGPVKLRVTSPTDIVPGDLLRITFASIPPRWVSLWVYLQVTTVADWIETSWPVWLTSEPAVGDSTAIVMPGADPPAWWLGASPEQLPPVEAAMAERLTFELHTRLAFERWPGQAADYPQHLSGLGFLRRHPKSWTQLPSDAQLYANAQPSPFNDPDLYALWQAASTPRFALWAGEQMGLTGIFLPTGMGGNAGLTPDVGPEDTHVTAVERNGLSMLDASVFVDPALAVADEHALMASADFVRFQQPFVDPTTNSQTVGRQLLGMHAALDLPETALIAVPDAAQRGWQLVPHTAPAPIAPVQPPPPPPPCKGDPLESGPGQFADMLTWPTPVLDPVPSPADGTYPVSWSIAPVVPAQFTLEEGTRDDLSDASRVYQGSDTSFEIAGRPQGAYFYRLLATFDSGQSRWSNVVAVRVGGDSQWRETETAEFNTGALSSVHSALLTMCAAQSDMFAVLSLPAHFREDDSIAYAAGLGRRLGGDPERALSFGAVYHPWTVVRPGTADDAVAVPPDGAMCGSIALRTLERGAWVAPANQLLQDVLALEPPLGRDRWLDLLAANINVVGRTPHGFTALSAQTLSDEDSVRPINVRRLLMLLRRLAHQVGSTYVFEPNAPAFARQVQQGFESVLASLFARGALAGATVSDAYRVDATAHPDAGALVAEIRVAPSRPLTFLTVRLVQTGDRSLRLVEGGA